MKPKYKRMITRMREKEEQSGDQSKKDWLLYILRCQDGSFYTGITKNLEARFKMHNDGKASRYTRTRRPVELLYQEFCGSRSQALIRECAVKGLSKTQKNELILSRRGMDAKSPILPD
jgi:putative endonuclease